MPKPEDQKLSPLVVVVGATASGKSSLALHLAQRFSGEIICADSWTVRRELNVGTAKPSLDERQLVPHHLLDIVPPDGDFTAAVFKDLANTTIRDIASRGKLSIMVGGTGLYIDGVIYDYGFLPEGDRHARRDLNQASLAELLRMINERNIELGEVDQRNKRRLIRLLETNGKVPIRHELRENTLIIGLQNDQQDLRERIIQRLDLMLENGLETEVRSLADKYSWEAEGLKGIGYREWQPYIEGHKEYSEVRESIIKSTVDLAKRQRTWFKRNKSIQWFNTPVNEQLVDDLVTTYLNN